MISLVITCTNFIFTEFTKDRLQLAVYALYSSLDAAYLFSAQSN